MFYLIQFKGRPTDETRNMKVLRYGEQDVKSYIPGSELIDLKKEKINGKVGKHSLNKNQENGDDAEDDEVDEGENGEDDNENEEEDDANDDSIDDDDDEEEEEEDEDNEIENGSQDEEEDDDGWVNINHSSDDDIPLESKDESEIQNGKSISKEDAEMRAIEASTQRIFTDEDFKRIQQEQLRRKVEYTKGDSSNKRKTISIDDSEDEEGERY